MALTLSIGPCPTSFRPVLKRQKSVPIKNSRMICMVRTVRVKEWPEGYMYAREYAASCTYMLYKLSHCSVDKKYALSVLKMRGYNDR